MIKKLTVLALTCLLCSSCYYSSNESFFVDVNTDVLPEIDIKTNLDVTDTINHRDSIFFKYEVLIDTGNIYFSQLFFNEEFIFYSEEMADSLWINLNDTLSAGTYDLSMEVIYKSSTGSLADRIDAEYLLKDASWQIVFGKEVLQ